MTDKIREAMLRAWCEYRGMEYVEGYVKPLPSDNFEKGFMACAEFIMSLPLTERLTDAEQDRIKLTYKKAYSDSFANTSCIDRQYARGRYQVLREIFGSGMVEKGGFPCQS